MIVTQLLVPKETGSKSDSQPPREISDYLLDISTNSCGNS
jgi:hypothetical protein